MPLLSQERLIGAAGPGPQGGEPPYPAEELDLLNLLAHHVATVFENARLFESATYEGLTGLLRREAILEQLDRRAGAGRALRPAAHHRHGRPRPLQGGQRPPRPPGRRRAAAAGVPGRSPSGLRSTDWIGRYGGEEFLLVLPETDIAGAAAVAEKIRSLVQGTLGADGRRHARRA